MSGSNYKKGGFIVLATLVAAVCFSVFLLTANFKPSIYAVTFNANGGSAVEAYIGVEEGRLISEPVSPVRDGFVFDGWFKDGGLTSEWVFGLDAVRRDTVLYAGWSTVVCRVSFEERSDNSVITIYGDASVPYGETVSVPQNDPSKTGYTFNGWKDGNGTPWDFASPIYGDTRLYADWTANVWVVTFESGGKAYDYARVVYGGKITKAHPDPSILGQIFLGWYTEDGVLWDFDRPYEYDGNITLYSKFETEIYRADYIYLYGASSYEDRLYGEKFTAPELPERNAEEFLGWYYLEGDALVPWNFAEDDAADVVLFETWRVNVVYSGYPQYDASSISGETAVPYAPDVTGYAFAGWYADPVLENEWNFADAVKENLVLYPKFEILEYTVIFVNNGIVVGIQYATYGVVIAPPNAAPPSADSFFGGWYFEDGNGNAVKLPSDYVAAADMMLFAVWWTEETLPDAPAETVRAYYRQKLVSAAETKYGLVWEIIAGGLVAAFDGEAGLTESYTTLRLLYETNLYLINLMPNA
jgi:uncharacterized repeat protein (TIGR02543 family)